jgi:glutamate N-acetyltransferase/amino-acid N-acetyltransferase
MWSEFEGGVTAPRGFVAAGVHCGVKRAKKDVAVVASMLPAHAAAMFTVNTVPAAPVLVDKQQLRSGTAVRALVINSGNANACTGERGLNDAWTMVRTAAAALGVKDAEVLVSSTGVIGQYLPMGKIAEGISAAVAALSPQGGTDAADAIMTTDTFRKQLAVRVDLGGTPVTLGGMAKGSGMIAPNMATMLGFVTTDAAVHPALLHDALREAVDRSFHRITVDGDTSTNDMVALMANGSAGNPVLDGKDDPRYGVFRAALEHLLVRLAKMIVVDGEGATKFVEITVRGASTDADAVRAARAVATSSLVKTAINGEDANWGRIIAAVGNSGITFDGANTEILFGDVPILRPHYVIDFSEERAREVLSAKEVRITVDLHAGRGQATFWTCDLSREYVAINASYRS